MTTKEKFAKLARSLHDRTNEGSIEWKYDDQFGTYAMLAGRLVSLGQSQNFNGEPLEVVTINSNDWSVLDSFTDEAFSGLIPTNASHLGGYYSMMAATRQMAYRQAVGADKAIDDILDQLSDDV